MGFAEAIRTCLRKYVDFMGRARRSEYWWFLLFGVLVGIAAGILDRILAPGYVATRGTGPVGMIASLAVFVRRLHDLDRTGWWALIFYGGLVVTIMVSMMAAVAGAMGMAGLFLLLRLALCIWVIIWMATRGTIGANRFGPDPVVGDAAPSPAM
jgi:uncharacterized membrane protein YhaH (DUF805 family)